MSTIATTSQAATASPLKHLVTQYPLVAYFVIAFVGAWLLWLPLVLARNGFGFLPFDLPSYPFVILGTFTGPTLAAFIMTALTEGKAGLHHLLSRYVQWRVGIQWYLLAIFALPVLFILATSLTPDAPSIASLHTPADVLSIILTFLVGVLLLIFIGPLGEEPGWRGFALPRLQKGRGPVVGSLLLGLLWGAWHVPLWFVAGSGHSGLLNFMTFVGGTMLGSIFITWVFNHTKGSLLVMILLHAAQLSTISILGVLFPGYNTSLSQLLGLAVVAALIIVFTRGRLSYKPNRVVQFVEASQSAETPSTVEVEHTAHS
jgi:membrane protease YdiL (CAAX protease family)